MALNIERRVLLTGGVGALALAAPEAAAQIWPFGRREAPIPVQHQGHGGHTVPASPAPETALTVEENTVVNALMTCDAVGQACLSHCLALMAQGDSSMAGCARAVREMLGVCAAARTLMYSGSSLAAAQLAVCRDACSACRVACEPHISHHAQCAACAGACARAVAAIDALMN